MYLYFLYLKRLDFYSYFLSLHDVKRFVIELGIFRFLKSSSHLFLLIVLNQQVFGHSGNFIVVDGVPKSLYTDTYTPDLCMTSSEVFPIQATVRRALFSFHLQDEVSLQRGAKLFMNYCSGCHSLKYLRYNHRVGQLGGRLFKHNRVFTQATINVPIQIALPLEDAQQWFGVVPPDLSLIARAKGTEWLYNYLSGFYNDNSRPFGTNNYLVPDVAMPNILDVLHHEVGDQEFNQCLFDLVAFLAYVGEPTQRERYYLGFFVIGFLVILFFTSWRLKIVYWRKIGIR